MDLVLSTSPEVRGFREPLARGDDPQKSSLEDTTYHTNLMDLSDFGIAGERVDPTQVPPKALADALLGCYFRTVHHVYPIVLYQTFMSQYDTFWNNWSLPDTGFTWLAILNMMFAIGVLGMESASMSGMSSEKEHLVYFVRARLLHPEVTSMLALPTIGHIQLSTLISIYFATCYQINRAWHVIGTSLRSAQALGLHLVDETPCVSDAEKEILVRLWHTINGVNVYVSFLSGRPGAMNTFATNTRIPEALEDEDPSESVHRLRSRDTMGGITLSSVTMLKLNILLDTIMTDTMFNLYSAGTVRKPWGDIQSRISDLNLRLSSWRDDVAPFLDTLIRQGPSNDSLLPEQMHLALRYFSTRIMIHRPCLCQSDEQRLAMPGQSKMSRASDAESSALCVTSAQDIVRLFPTSPDLRWLLQSAPWWCVLHYLVQAGAILIMEIGFNAVHVPNKLEHIVNDARKVVRWLQKMAETATAAHRAWVSVSRLLARHLQHQGHNRDNLRNIMPPASPGSRQVSFNQMEAFAFSPSALFSPHAASSTGSAAFPQTQVHPPEIYNRGHGPTRMDFETDLFSPSLQYMPALPMYDMWGSGPHITPQVAEQTEANNNTLEELMETDQLSHGDGL